MELVPFSAEAFEGFADVKGLIRLDGDVLILEFQTQDAFVGVVKSDMKEVKIPVHEVAMAEVEGRFRPHLILQVRRMNLVVDIPQNQGGRVKLRVARKHKEVAEELVAEIKLRLTEQRYNKAIEESQPFEEGS